MPRPRRRRLPGAADGSGAAAYVSGTAALLLSQDPSLTVAELLAALVGGVDPGPALEDKVLADGRLTRHGPRVGRGRRTAETTIRRAHPP